MGHHNFGMYIRNGTRYVRRSDLEEADIQVIYCFELKFHKFGLFLLCANVNNNNVLFDYLDDITCKS